jgi:hypothetical protein
MNWKIRIGVSLSFVGAALCANQANAADPFDRAGAHVRGDFDGDDVVDDVAGSPETNCGKGAIYVLMGDGGSTSWTEDTSGILGTAACDEHFGASLAVGDFDNDGYDDLAIGTPGGNDSGSSAGGSVHVFYGSASGLTATGDQIWHQNVSGIEGVAEASDYMGDALTTGDFNCDGYDDLAIGVPREDITTTTANAGAVNVIFGSSSGLSTVDSIWEHGVGGVFGTSEANDYFGAALAAGNFNGDTAGGNECDEVAIGAPNEDGGASDSGYVYIIDGTTSGLNTTGDQGIDQDVSGVAGVGDASDQFGFRLEVVDLDGDSYDDLWVTVPGDGCVTSAGWGRHIFHGSSGGLSFSNDTIDCDQYSCEIDAGFYGCMAASRPIHGSSGNDEIWLYFRSDVAVAWDGADTITGSLGNDVVLAGGATIPSTVVQAPIY